MLRRWIYPQQWNMNLNNHLTVNETWASENSNQAILFVKQVCLAISLSYKSGVFISH